MGFKIESLNDGDKGKYASIVDGHFLHKLNKVNDVILRDYFAGLAMTTWDDFTTISGKEIAEWAYSMADEMMKARKGKNNG